MANGYGDYINSQYKKDKKPKVYKTTGTQYNKTEVKERAEIRSQLANDVAYWEQKRGKKSDNEKNHVAIAENYYKRQERRKEVEEAGQKRMSANKGKGKYSQEDRLQEYKDVRDKNRKSESKEYEKRIGDWAVSDFKKQNNYGANKGLVESDVRFRAYMDKQKGKKDSVAQSLIPEFLPKKKKEKSFLDKVFDTVNKKQSEEDKAKSIKAGERFSNREGNGFGLLGTGKLPKGKLSDSLDVFSNLKKSDGNPFTANKRLSEEEKAELDRIVKQGVRQSEKKGEIRFGDKPNSRFQAQAQTAFSSDSPKQKMLNKVKANPNDKELQTEYEKLYGGDLSKSDIFAQVLGYGAGGIVGAGALKGTALGAKGLGSLLSKPLTKASVKEIAKQTGKEGAAIGGLIAGGEVASREFYNPEDNNWKQNLGKIGLEAGIGAVADPLLTVGGAKLLSKLKPKAKNNFDDVAKLESSELPFTMDEPPPTVKPQTADSGVFKIDEVRGKHPELFNADGSTNHVKMNAWKKTNLDEINSQGVNQTAVTSDAVAKPYEPIVQSSVKKLDENGKPIKINKNQKFKDLAENAVRNSDLWKDKGPLRYGRETLERNFEDIASKEDAQFLKDNYVQPIRQKETERIRFVNKAREDVKNLGIKPNSQDDKLTQMYGEKKLSLENLKKETPNWEKVKKAAEWHRNNYDQLITSVNKILTDAGEQPIGILEDYFPHYQGVEGIFATLKKAGFDVENHTLPTSISGQTENFKPNKKFFSHALSRTTDETKYGAIEGFDRYIEGVSQLMYHTENIKNIRAFENALRNKHGDSHLTHLVPYLKEHGNLMAGKKAGVDRIVEEKVGRWAYNALDTIKRRTGLNMLGYSVSSASSALIPLTQAAATTKPTSFLKGMTDTVTNLVRKDGFADKSGFLTRRIGSQPLVRNTWSKIENNSMGMMDMVDRFASQTIVRGKYYELLDKGIDEKEALKQADDWAGRVMTDRSKGQQPTMFAPRTLGPLMQFQVEVNNQVSFIFKDIPKNAKNKKQLASQLTQVLVYSYLYNQVAEQVLGRRPAFDPAGVAQEAYANFMNEDMDKKESTGRLLKDVAGQLPFSSTFTGGRYPIDAALPNRKLDDYTQGKTTIEKEAWKPLKYLVLPAGGSQLNKMYEGGKILNKEGVYTEKGDLRYPVENNTENLLRGLVLGKSSFPETKEFYDKPFHERRALGSNQTKEYEYAKSRGLGKEFYDDTILKRTEKGKRDKMNDAFKDIEKLEKDKTLSDKEREKRIEKILQSIGR